MKPGIYTVQHDVPNPNGDRRQKHDWRWVPEQEVELKAATITLLLGGSVMVNIIVAVLIIAEAMPHTHDVQPKHRLSPCLASDLCGMPPVHFFAAGNVPSRRFKRVKTSSRGRLFNSQWYSSAG